MTAMTRAICRVDRRHFLSLIGLDALLQGIADEAMSPKCHPPLVVVGNTDRRLRPINGLKQSLLGVIRFTRDQGVWGIHSDKIHNFKGENAQCSRLRSLRG
jgi:hypothetical protein